jgi:ABC-type oligopeptide transport system substrate-binding subunit
VKRQLFVLLSLVVLASLLLAACGTPATEPPAATQPPATEPPMTEPPTAAPTEPPAEPTPVPPAPIATFDGTTLSVPDCDYAGLFKSIEATDQYTVTFNMCSPDPAFLSIAPFAIFRT